MTWKEIKTKAIEVMRENNLQVEYAKRLKYEIKEIEKQGANKYWVDKVIENKCIDSNKNGLVLPFLLKLTSVDPIKSNKILIGSEEDGIKDNAIIIQLENGYELCVSENTEILTTDGYIKASELTVDHTIL